jgi:hypothetical protein
MSNKALALETWAGRRYYPCEVLSQTRSKYRIKLLAKDGAMLPGKRRAVYGQIVTVLKRARNFWEFSF